MIKFLLLAAIAFLLTPWLAALVVVGAWLVTTPAGPVVALVAIVAQAQRSAPAYAVMIVESDREFLASLLARGV